MNRFTIHASWCMILSAGLLCACSNNDEDVAPTPTPTPSPTEKPSDFVLKAREDISLTSEQKKGIEMQNDFAFRLFAADNKDNSGNSLISPLSLTMCVSMAANGASEEVKDEIVEKLLPNGGDLDQLNTLNKYLVESLLDVDNSSILTLANSVWVDKNFSLLTPFSQSIREFYNAESDVLDMSSSKAADRINEWVSTTTNGLIPQLFTGAPGCSMTLINTLYFNGAWWDPFEQQYTKKALFNNENGQQSEVEFMNKTNIFDISVTSDYSVLQLPYGNKAFNFYAVMPSEGNSLDLTTEKWNNIKNGLQSSQVIIAMPKFEIQYEVGKMEEKMENAGISKLFSSKDALINTVSPVNSESSASITGDVRMIHKTVFKVNEIGAEGAGLSAVVWVTEPDSGESYKIPEIILNRPFVYIVEEQSTGAILFIGAVRNL